MQNVAKTILKNKRTSELDNTCMSIKEILELIETGQLSQGHAKTLVGLDNAVFVASKIVEKGKGNGEVLNGIAFNKKTQKLYVTGKFWPKTFEVKIN